MNRQFRRLIIGYMLRHEPLNIADTTFGGFIELVAGRGEEKLQAEFDKRVAAVEHLVFPDNGYRKAFNTDRDAEAEDQECWCESCGGLHPPKPEADRQETIAQGVMIRHRESLAKLDDDKPTCVYGCRSDSCDYFYLPSPSDRKPEPVVECPQCGGKADLG